MLAPTCTMDMDELVPAHWGSARVPDSRTDVRMDGELRWTAQEQRPALAGIQAHRADTTAAPARFPARVASPGSGDSGTRRGGTTRFGRRR
jgi:hypothetical protein